MKEGKTQGNNERKEELREGRRKQGIKEGRRIGDNEKQGRKEEDTKE